jgi:hypothetical protein
MPAAHAGHAVDAVDTGHADRAVDAVDAVDAFHSVHDALGQRAAPVAEQQRLARPKPAGTGRVPPLRAVQHERADVRHRVGQEQRRGGHVGMGP